MFFGGLPRHHRISIVGDVRNLFWSWQFTASYEFVEFVR